MYNYPMHEIAKTIQNLPTYAAYACAAGVGVCTIGAGAYWIARKLARSARQIAAVSLVGAVLIGGMVVVGTDDAGTKPSTNDVTQVEGDTNTTTQVEGGTNDVGQAGGDLSGTNDTGSVGGPLMLGLFGHPNLGQMFETITDEDIAQGWRVFSVVSNNATTADVFAFSNANAVCASVWEAAQRHGAVYGHWALPLGEWLFPFGDSGWTHLFLRCEGVLRDSFREDVNQIRFLAPFALCPAANWPRYNLSASRAWCATNDVGGLTVAVENGALGNDPAQIACARIDLDPSFGEIRLRYDLSRIGERTFDVGPTLNGTNTFVTVGSNTSEVVFRRVHPDDFDFDGLPNALDPSPRQPDSDAGWNQGDAWAMLAFPSNAAEIASMGYAAWAAARAAEPNRLLLGLEFASAKNAWPVCLTFGGVQVMYDGTQEIVFPIDRGAHYPFSVPGGGLVGVRVIDTLWFADFFPDLWFVPYDRQVGDLTVHLDSPGSGWIGTTAEVSVDGLDGTHFFPDDSRAVTAVVTNCHEDAYIGCIWSGGEGVSFSNRHSLETFIYWNETNALAWATNYVDLVTTYEGGYAVTNHCVFTVGTQTEPTPSLELTCPTNLFLNSTLYSNYVERVYPASVKVTAPHGARGRLWLDVDNDSGIRLYADRERTAGMPSEIVVEIPEVGDYGTNVSFFVTCPRLGMGRIQASLFLTDGTEKDAQVDVLVIEPERRLVMDEHDARTGIIVNPSRLVYGTNAVLKVGVHQSGNDFNPMDITWHPISGNCRMSPTNGLSVVVEPTTDSGVAVVEARFNDDAVQPRFVLPIVRWRELAVKAFVVQPPEDLSDKAWTIEDVNQTIAAANSVYSQIGVRFNLQEIVMEGVGTSADWNLQRSQVVTNGNRKTVVLSNQAARLFDHYKSRDCIELYFVGTIIPGEVIAFHHPNGIAISKKGVDSLAVAHEIGHALGLKDCYALNKVGVTIGKENEPVVRGMFSVAGPDWGDETSHGYYAFDDSLGKMLRSMLMCGRVDDGMFGTDIPDDWIESLEANTLSTNQTTHATVGARTVESKAEAEIYSK